MPTIASPEPSCTSHDQPEPNWLTPVSLSLRLKVREGAEGLSDRLAERPARLAAAVGRHALPEERVVVVPAAVVADGRALVLGHLREVAQHVLDRGVGQRGPLERRVRLVHVGLVMLVVVEFHRRLVDMRFERLVGVGERRDGVGHGGSFSVSVDGVMRKLFLSEAGPCP